MIQIERISPNYYKLRNLTLTDVVFENVKKKIYDILSFENEDYYAVRGHLIKKAIRRFLDLGNPYKDIYVNKDKEDEGIITVEAPGYDDIVIRLSKKKSFFRNASCKFGVGFINKVKKCLKESSVSFELKDKKINPKKVKFNKDDFNRKFQYYALRAFFDKGGYGIIKNPTGSGKTFLALACSRILSENFKNSCSLYLLDSVGAIEKDVKTELSKFGFINYQILDSKLDFEHGKDLYIITIQSLQEIHRVLLGKVRKRKGKPIKLTEQKIKQRKELIKRFNEFKQIIRALLIDESHCYGSVQRKNTLALFKHAYVQMYLSGTPYSRNSELKKNNIKETQGVILYTIKEEKLKKKKFLADTLSIFIDCYSPSVDNTKFKSRAAFSSWWDAYIIGDRQRNFLITMVDQILKEFGLKVVYLTRRIPQGEKLSKTLKIPLLKGETQIEERINIMQRFKEYATNFIATGIFNKSVNLPEMKVFVNCAGGKEQNLEIQRRGRVVRRTEKDTKKIFIDFIDWGNDYLEDHSSHRLEAVRAVSSDENIKHISINDLNKVLTEFLGYKKSNKVKTDDSVIYEPAVNK